MSQSQAIARITDIPDGGMIAVKSGEDKVLLLRDGAIVTAVGAICPHAGGLLAEGVRRGNRVVCPWHKAAFCTRTGAVLDPPAVDPLPRFDVRVTDGQVFLSPPATEPAKNAPAKDDRCFVIIGAGAAGAIAAQTLREAGFGGRVLMLDRDNRVPYDRTILNKYFLAGTEAGEKSPLQSQSYYTQHGIERLTAEVRSIDPHSRRICLGDGSGIGYDAALIASGSTPTPPPIPGADLRNTFTLRSRADADAILAQAERSGLAVIAGGSFIGMEVAASLRERGLAVTVVTKEAVPFAAKFGEPIGKALLSLHEKYGVDFRLESEVARLEGDTAVRSVSLESGEQIAADLVVFGLGVTPETGFAQNLSQTKDGGILVDPWLRAADALYAAGDVAAFPYRGNQGLIRVEHWRVAQQQGRVAALNMLGQQRRYDAVPVFWTIHYLKRLDYIGHADEWDELVIHGDITKLKFLAYYIKDDGVIAAAGLGRDQDMAALIELFDKQRDWTAEALGANPAEILKALRD